MKKNLGFMALFVILLAGCGNANTDTDQENAGQENATATESSSVDTSSGDESNLLEQLEAEYISNDDNDNILGSDGDTSYDMAEGLAKTGLKVNIEIKDTDGNNTINLDEPLKIKVEIVNEGNQPYIISKVQLRSGTMFEKGNWKNLKTNDMAEKPYTLDDKLNRIETNISDVKVEPKEKMLFEFDGSIGAGEEDKNISRYDSDTERGYIKFQFIATGDDDNMIYFYESGDQKVKIDLTK